VVLPVAWALQLPHLRKTEYDNMAMLEIDNIHSYYGSIHALKGISLTVDKGEIVTLIGANGAGKSTTLRTVSGLMKPRIGRILLEGEDITSLKAHNIVGKGVALVPEGRRIFSRLTVAENLDMGAYVRNRKDIPQELDRVFTLFPRLKERINQVGGTLSGGEQQMLSMARAMMTHPRVLLMDEPSMGLAPVLVEAIFETIQSVNKQEGTTILLVEQNALMALSVASRGYVLETGTIVLSDSAENLRTNESVQKSYLGIE
jgi:branched-chain amino acid transport system ATP-binding protein